MFFIQILMVYNNFPTVKWPKYCRYGVKLCTINQYNFQSNFESQLIVNKESRNSNDKLTDILRLTCSVVIHVYKWHPLKTYDESTLHMDVNNFVRLNNSAKHPQSLYANKGPQNNMLCLISFLQNIASVKNNMMC